MQKMKIAVWVLVGVMCLATSLAASDAVIKGVVTDAAGKPVRGALVKASTADKSVSRFTQNDGRYEITVPAGSYDVSVDAFGFGVKRQKKDAAQAGDTDFSLTPRLDVTRLSSAQLEGLVPDDVAGLLVKSMCIDCHGLDVVLQKRGMTAADWASFLPHMMGGRRTQRTYEGAKLAALTAALEKYFGPDAPYMGPDADPLKPEQIKHAAPSDATLKATIREWSIPTTGADAFPHTVFLDQQSRILWFAEIGLRANKITSFDTQEETFNQYALPMPQLSPHSGLVGKDGRVWVALATSGHGIISVDPKTGQMKEYPFPPGVRGGGRTMSMDQAGNLWVTGGGSNQIMFFDVKSGQFKSFKYPVPDVPPPNTVAAWEHVPGEPSAVQGAPYHVSVDSKGMVWLSLLSTGKIVRVDPATGATKEYQPPDVPGIRGIKVDSHDNIWFADYFHHRLGKLDQKTEAFKMYQPPTAGANPYGIVEDGLGNIWYGDQGGNNITRFDPKTEQFAEYPLPNAKANPRFIEVAKDGRIWFGEYWNGKIGVLDPGEGSKQQASR